MERLAGSRVGINSVDLSTKMVIKRKVLQIINQVTLIKVLIILVVMQKMAFILGQMVNNMSALFMIITTTTTAD